jgi:hypothetical protein
MCGLGAANIMPMAKMMTKRNRWKLMTGIAGDLFLE